MVYRPLADLLGRIITRSGLDPQDAYPLYAYRTTDDELQQLRESFVEIFSIRSDLIGEERAAFCLFAAEWFRRHHRGGPWKWATILEDGLALSPRRCIRVRQTLNEVTYHGLAWWEQEVIRTTSSYRYLTTLACQGGLPLHMLRQHGNTLWRYFRDVLQQYERYPDASPIALAQEADYILPQTLRHEVVHEVTAQLISAVVELRRLCVSADGEDSDHLDYLEKYVPRWRQRIPLSLDDEVADELLRGLMRERAQPVGDAELTVTAALVLQAEEARVVRDLSFEREIEESRLAQFLKLAEDELPPRLQLYLDGNGARVAVAFAARMHGKPTFRLQRLPHSPLSGQYASGRIMLAAVVGSSDLAVVDPPGGDPLPDLPWTFEATEPNRMIGVGSLRTRRTSVLVALPQGYRLLAADADEVTKKAVMRVEDRDLYLVCGLLRASEDGITVSVIRTNGPDEAGSTFSMRGRRVPLGPGGSEVWQELSGVCEHKSDRSGPSVFVAKEDIQWRPARGGRQWLPLEHSGCLGEVVLRVVRDAEISYQSRLVVVPDRFQFASCPGPRLHEGAIRLTNLGATEIHVAADQGMEVTVKDDKSGSFEIHVLLQSKERPATLALRATFPDGSRAELQTAFPVPRTEIIDAAERPWPAGVPVPLDHLDGLRLFAVLQQDETLQLRDKDGRYLATLQSVQGSNQTYQLPLSLIHSKAAALLARSSDPDKKLRLEVQRKSTQVLWHFDVSRHLGELRICKRRRNALCDGPDEEIVDENVSNPLVHEISVAAERFVSLIKHSDGIRLELKPLGHPDQAEPPGALERLDERSWLFHTDRCSAGPWLVTAWVDEQTCLRPSLITVRGGDEPGADPTAVDREERFDAVVNIVDREQRSRAWRTLILEVAEDPSHPAWDPLMTLVDACTTLPVTTFEAVSELVKNPQATAYAMIQKIDDAILWERLEQLPFLWSLLPIRAWISAARRTVDHVRTELSQSSFDESTIEELASASLVDFAKLAPIRGAGMGCIVGCLFIAGLPVKPEPEHLASLHTNAKERLCKDLEMYRTRLVSGHAQDRWPESKLSVAPKVDAYTSKYLLRDGQYYHKLVLDAPVVAAAHAVLNAQPNSDTVAVLQEAKGFDPIWYEAAHHICMCRMAGDFLNADPEFFAR